VTFTALRGRPDTVALFTIRHAAGDIGGTGVVLPGESCAQP